MSALVQADAERIAAGLGAGAKVSQARGEVTLDLPRERIADACAAARDAGYDFLCDLAATDYLGFAAEGVAGYWGSPSARAATRPQPPGVDRPRPPSSRRRGDKRFAVSYQLLDRTSRPARRLRLRVWADDGEPVPSIVGVFPCADYQEREAWDLMGIAVRRPPRARADLPARGLGRPPAPQGLSHRRRARPVLGRGLMASTLPEQRAVRHAARRGALADPVGADPPGRRSRHDAAQPRAEPPVDARRAAARRDAQRRDRGRPAQRARLRAHGHREEHGAEVVLEGDHVRARADYNAFFSNELVYCMAVEKLLELEVPRRGEWIRAIFTRAAAPPQPPDLPRHRLDRPRRHRAALLLLPRARPRARSLRARGRRAHAPALCAGRRRGRGHPGGLRPRGARRSSRRCASASTSTRT